MRFIGDVHCKFKEYENLIKGVPQSVQLGDMGIGFCRLNEQGKVDCPSPPYEAMKQEGDHRFIRGNHDNPSECRQQPLWIPDGHIEGDMFFCGGALSVNLKNRTEGLNWWPEEELSVPELDTIQEKYLDAKPSLMVTHDCPFSIAEAMLRDKNIDKSVAVSRTRQAFNGMWNHCKPDTWIFGHWHLSFDKVISGTRFICLNELEFIDL